MVFDLRQNDGLRFMDAVAFDRPFSSGVDHIPIRASLFVTSFAGVVIPKSIHGGVPKRTVEFYESGFDGAYHVRARMLKNNKPAHEIIRAKVWSNLQVVVVLAQAAAKLAGLIFHIIGNTGLPPTFRYSFANVDRVIVSRAVELGIAGVERVRAGVINRINSTPQEGNWRWQCQNRRAVKKSDGIFDQLSEGIVSINVFRSVEWSLFHWECCDMTEEACAGNFAASTVEAQNGNGSERSRF